MSLEGVIVLRGATPYSWAVVRVGIVDDEQVIRDGLAMILQTHEEFEVVGSASDGVEALELVGVTEIDVLLLDLQMPRLDGLGVLRHLSEGSGPRVLVLTTFDADDSVRRALGLGAAGFLLKSSPHERIAAAINAVMAGEMPMSPSVMESVVQTFVSRNAVDPDDERRLAQLTRRELEILRLLGRGLSNDELARELVLSRHTIKTHVSRLLSKTGCSSRGQAAALAHRSAARLDEALREQ